jgi:hypothetical protein
MKSTNVKTWQLNIARRQLIENNQHLVVKLLILIFTFQFLISSISCFSQLSISPTPKAPDNSAILDVSSSIRGVLINRMNTAQRDAITPDANAVSLLIFNIDTKCFETYVNGGWFTVSCPAGCVPPVTPASIAATNVSCTTFTANWNPSPGAFSYYLDISSDNFNTFVSGYSNVYAGNVTSINVIGLTSGVTYYYRVRAATGCISGNSNIGTVTLFSPPPAPVSKAATNISCNQFTANWNKSTGATAYFLDVSTDNFSTFISGYNNFNAGNVTSYNITGLISGITYSYRVRAASACASQNSGTITVIPGLPSAPTSATNYSSQTQIVWNWNTVNGATGYRYSTSSTNYLTANDNGVSVSFTQTGLSCGSKYTLYVWAYNSCGNSSYTTIQQTLACNCNGTGIISTIAGGGASWPNGGYGGDGGAATNAQLQWPIGVAVDGSGNIYIGDTYNNRIRKVTNSTGIITTIAGTGIAGSSGDGGPATSAQLNFPCDVALDGSGNVYIGDLNNNKVRKVNVSTGIISTIAGGGSSGDGAFATNASLNGPFGVAVDASGNVYIAEYNGNKIRKVNISTGIISTIAGGGSSGDGSPATSASLSEPISVAVDAAGNVYISEWSAGRARKVTASTGLISTIAGGNGWGNAGDGGQATAAQMMTPEGIALDSYGNVYISDENNRRIRKVTVSTGIISTVAGNSCVSYNGDGIPATNACMWDNAQIWIDNTNTLYITDPGNNRIRKVCP